MFGSYTYLIFNIIFAALPLYLAFGRHRKSVWEYRKMIFWGIIIGIPWATLGDAYGILWHSWHYSYNETLNIQLGGAVLETVMWGVLLMISLGMIVAVFADKEEKKRSFKPYL